MSGATVNFTAPSTGASATLSSPTAVTNASGVASVNATASLITGNYSAVTASYQGATATFSLTNTTFAFITATGGTPQSTTVGTAFPVALQITLKDALGNPVNGITVTFAAPATGAGATLSSPTAVTNASGVASVTATANTISGAYTVTANVGSLSAAFSLTNTAGAPASIAATGGTPQSALVGTAFPVALQATVKDAGGNPGVPGVYLCRCLRGASHRRQRIPVEPHRDHQRLGRGQRNSHRLQPPHRRLLRHGAASHETVRSRRTSR